MIPLSRPSIGHAEIDAISRVLRSGWLAHGPEVGAFEREFADYVGVRHAVAVNSCASALQLAFLAAGVRGEVITPSFTFVATANAILAAGCAPVFVDIDESTCTLDPAAIAARVTARTVAVMPVHFAGQCCRMDEIMAIARRQNLLVVEDSAEAIGATYAGRIAGSFGIGCFSFYPTKNMTTGEGGILTTDDGEFAARVRALRSHGLCKDDAIRERWPASWHRVALLPGYNYRMTDFQAALGRVQLARLDGMNAARRAHASYLSRNLRLAGIRLPEEMPGCRHVFQMYTIQLDPDHYDRDRFVGILTELGIGATVHFDPPLHLQPCYANATPALSPLPVTERVARTIVTLPMYPDLSEDELDRIVQAVCGAAEHARRRPHAQPAMQHGRPPLHQPHDGASSL
jgi:perosamine synthetase